MKDMQAIMSELQQRLPEVGDYQLSFFRRPDAVVGYEKQPREVVSLIDIESEKRIRKILHEILPEAKFYGEETSQQIGEEYTWVVDPIDGTLNFINGLKEWCISVGLLYRREPVLGIVYRPVSGEFYHAIKGNGAWLDETRLPIYDYSETLQEAFLATGMPFRSPDVSRGFFKTTEAMLPKCREIRRLGSAALDMVNCAAGFYQGYWETDLRIYDICAALVILGETEMIVQDFFGNPYDHFTGRSMIVARKEILNDFSSVIEEGYAEYKDLLLEGYDQTGDAT